MKKWFPYLLVALIIVPLITVYAYQDDLTTIFNSWVSGKPKIMIKLEIHIPLVNAELCGVAVLRSPSHFRPTKTGFSEEVYSGIHKPGEIVVVKQILAAIVAKTKLGEEYEVEYYEPAEYLVAVVCRNDKTVYRYVKLHEVFPKELVTTYRVKVKFEKQSNVSLYEAPNEESSLSSVNPNTLSCVFIPINPPPGRLRAAVCYTWVRGPYLYSLPGLETAFGLVGGIPPSAVYIDAYFDAAICGNTGCYPETPQWNYNEKRLTPSVVSKETARLSGRFKDRVYFYVEYRYEEYYTGTMPAGVRVWIIYPTEIRNCARSEESPQVPYEKQYQRYIPPAPPYAPRTVGDALIWFTPTYESAYESGNIIVSTSISFDFSAVLPIGTVTLSIGFYKSGRRDNFYTTPYVSIKDVSGNTQAWYYWWYRDNDKMTYEVQLFFYR